MCYQAIRLSDSDLTVTLVTGTCVASPTQTGVSPGPCGHTVSTGVTSALSTATDIYRETGGVGSVQSVALLTPTGVAALQVDTEAVLQGAVMAVRTSGYLTLVHILTVGPITLQSHNSGSVH